MSYTFTIGGTAINTTDTKPYVLAKSLKIVPRADNRNDCFLTVITTANTFLPRVGHALVVVDGAETVFGGIIQTARRYRPGAGTGADTTIYVDVWSDGYNPILSRLAVRVNYIDGQDGFDGTAGYIIKDIRTKFLSQCGITEGTINDGADIAAYKKDVLSGKELYDNLADISGYKWWIDNSKALHFAQED